MRVAAHYAVEALKLVHHELQQRAFARAVGADEGNARIKINTEIQLGVQNLVWGVTKRHVGKLKHRRRQRAALVEVQLDGLFCDNPLR